MPIMLTDLADVLRRAGLKVVEEQGWKTRGRAWARQPVGIVQHHTGPGSLAGQVRVVRDGRADLPGPLSQLVLAEDGTFHVIAAGRANHAGRSAWQGYTDLNDDMIGIEADNDGDGRDIWEQAQIRAAARGSAALATHFGFSPIMIAGHKEIALPRGRKIDPTYDMPSFRALVAEIMDDLASPAGELPPKPVAIPTVDPRRAMLQRGSQGLDVLELQSRLRALGYRVAANGIFSWETDTRVREFQKSKGLVADGLVGPKTWAALG
jgi:hypothetical protein